MPKIAIIGAGVSGLAAAFQLSQNGAEVSVFEKSCGFSGRAASRSKHGCRYDYGANFFKVSSEEVTRLIFHDLPTEDLHRITGEIWTFTADGQIEPGDPKMNAEAKWSYRGGISSLGKLLVEKGKLSVERQTEISSIKRIHHQWTLTDRNLISHSGFDAILITAPAPQTIALLNRSEIDSRQIKPLTDELAKASYHRQYCVVLNLAGELSLPGGAYALINMDRAHPIAWLSHENQKAGHVPAGETLFVVQMSPEWTRDHFEDPEETVIATAHHEVASLLSMKLPLPRWTDTQRWRYAHPHSAANHEPMKPAAKLGLFFAGDAFVGKGRITRAIRSGLEASNQLQHQLWLGDSFH